MFQTLLRGPLDTVRVLRSAGVLAAAYLISQRQHASSNADQLRFLTCEAWQALKRSACPAGPSTVSHSAALQQPACRTPAASSVQWPLRQQCRALLRPRRQLSQTAGPSPAPAGRMTQAQQAPVPLTTQTGRSGLCLCCVHDRMALTPSYTQELLPEAAEVGSRLRSASDASVLRRKGHLKEQDAWIELMISMHHTHTCTEVMAKFDRFCLLKEQAITGCFS